VNPDLDEVDRMMERCIVPGETLPDRDMLDVIAGEYVINETSSPAWTTKEVTIGLPINHDCRRSQDGTKIYPIKKKIPRHECLTIKSIRRK